MKSEVLSLTSKVGAEVQGLQPTLARIEAVEARCLELPQVACPTTHVFAKGVYWREVAIPAGVFAMGHEHKTEHINVLLAGKVRVMVDGRVTELTAPQVIVSGPGIRKVVYAVTATRWANVHANPTDETDLDKIEDLFIEKSAGYLAHKEGAPKWLS